MSEEKAYPINQAKQSKIRPLTEEQKRLCEQWKISGINREQFCDEHRIPISTFYGWCSKLWPNKKSPKSLFSPVAGIVALPPKNKEQGTIEIKLPNQAIVKMTLPLTEVASLIQDLCHATTIIR